MTDKKILDRRFYPAGSLIIEEGARGDCAYYIESGLVEVFTHDPDGREIRLSILGVEEVFGEMALISHDRRVASVRTVEDSTIITITPEDFKLAYASSDKVFSKLLNVLVNRLVDANHYIVTQHKEIADLEGAAHNTVKNVSYSLPPELQERFQKDIRPILEELMAVLNKYKELSSEKLDKLREDNNLIEDS